jgi:hypothetical protein
MGQPENIIFWGAGATAALGIRTTDCQARFIKHITGVHAPRKKLTERVAEALGSTKTKRWRSALCDLITILGDSKENYASIDCIHDEQFEAMRRNWNPRATDEELRSRIIELRLFYDWPALKSLVSICPGSSRDTFKLNDLFNLLDLHIPLGFGVRAPGPPVSGTRKSQEQFFDARRLIGAKNALRTILIASSYIDYQECIATKRDVLKQYHELMVILGRRMQQRGGVLAAGPLNEPDFYQGDVGFVSLNYDPIALWLQFLANRDLNKGSGVTCIGSPPVPLHLFHDFGHMIPARRIGKPNPNWPWYPLNEATAQRLNEQSNSDSRVRLTKFLFPHGCLCWRECPDCRKLSAFHGDGWSIDAPGLFPPPPLRAFDEAPIPDWVTGEERERREQGAVDARACLHCRTLTYAHHTQTVMQSSFKSAPPSFIEEIQRELRATTMQAKHIIFMGYSLPPDDVGYRALFAATRQRTKGQPVRCTIVDKKDGYPEWYGPAALKARIRKFPKEHPLNAAVDFFGEGNVRFYGGGVPKVFLDRGKATEAKLEQLLNWSSTP